MDEHRLIQSQAVAYADRMCDGDDEAVFSRGSIAAAYVIGAEKTLRLVLNVINASAMVGGIDNRQSAKLVSLIEGVFGQDAPPEAAL